jgi:predicted lysophospholipase L1 biosynthesis ABC-type transport system permease subunit
LTNAGLIHALCAPGPLLVKCRQMTEEHNATNGGIRASFASGPRGRAAFEHFLRTYSSVATKPVTPTSLVNFGEAVNFPLIFGAVLAVFGAATLMHLLVVSVSRRRREVGLLKVLGFVNGQVVSSVAWQASTLALVGIVIGVPLGLVIGQGVWRAFANNLGVVPVTVVPVLLIGGLAAGVLVVANLIALGPALASTRSRPGDLLRTSQLNTV